MSTGINDSGQMVGYYYYSSNDYHGSLYSNGTFTTLSYLGAVDTSASDINSSGEIVGSYSNDKAVEGHGFFYTDSIFHTLDYPGKQITNLSGVNNLFGFIDDNGTITPFIYPGATSTSLADINNSGQYAGDYVTPVQQPVPEPASLLLSCSAVLWTFGVMWCQKVAMAYKHKCAYP